MQPSIITNSYAPHDGQAAARDPPVEALGSDFNPNPAPSMKPIATRCSSITPPIAARIEGMYLPCIQAPPRGSNTAFNSSTTNDTSPPRRNTAEIIRVSATVQA